MSGKITKKRNMKWWMGSLGSRAGRAFWKSRGQLSLGGLVGGFDVLYYRDGKRFMKDEG